MYCLICQSDAFSQDCTINAPIPQAINTAHAQATWGFTTRKLVADGAQLPQK